ncbi:MAG: efflux RND transporter periplasmic adaptor subunit [Candidatus Cloacimonetes bacterium]|nr:efflux RND transporter periplasmic adaptor subunit [Candidatus Cloacimonadota bacterium]
MKRLISVLLAIFLLFSLGCGKKNQQSKLKHGVKKNNHLVVKRGSITVKLEETGEVKPIKEIDIKSKISGKILKFYVEEGDFVKSGDLIADIEPDYNQAEKIARVKSSLKLNEIRLRNATKDFEDKKKLAEYISKTELNRAEDTFIEAKLNYEDAFAQYELIKEIEAEGNVSKIISSASGTLILKSVEEGEMVVAGSGAYAEGTIIVKLADLQRMVISSRINEVDIAKVSKGQKVDIQLDAFPYDKFYGKINKIAAMAVKYNNVKVFPIEVEIIDVSSKIKPGMTANITIIGEDKKEIIVLPIRAIFSDATGLDIVYKVSNDTISGSRIIKTGINDFQQVEIIEGIAEGDTISLVEKSKNDVEFKMSF